MLLKRALDVIQLDGGRRWSWGLALANRFGTPKNVSSVKKRNSASWEFLASCSRVETACGVVSTGEGRKNNYVYVYPYLGIS